MEGDRGYPLTACNLMIVPKEPMYVSIAETLKTEILAGNYDNEPLPGSTALAERFDVNVKTTVRAIQRLAAEGVVIARPGMRAVPVPAELRSTRWPSTGRYARARATRGLIFGGDVAGDVRKDTVSRDWVEPPIAVAQLLDVDEETQVLQRRSRTYIDDVPTEDTSMFLPANIVQAAPRLESDDRIQVVKLIEESGHRVTRTTNEIRARHASASERKFFGLNANNIVIEHVHGTYGANGEALEAVVNVRPAKGNVITFETFEAAIEG